MNPIAKLGAFAAVLLLAFGGGAALGAVVGPDDSPRPAPEHGHTSTTVAHDGHEEMTP